MDKPHAIVIGAGFTGVAISHDLALRGFDVTVVERGPIGHGTSGRTHGVLHSGGRYCVKDTEAGIECIEENMIIRKIVPEVVEPNGGLFIAITEEDLAYGESFIEGAQACGIPIEELKPEQALKLEPNLNPNLLVAFTVPDATFDPLRLAMAFAATAKSNGAKYKLFTEVEDLLLDGKGNVIGVKVKDRHTDKEYEIHSDIVVNATGAWVGQITAMAGAHVPIGPTPGIMVAYDQRLVERTINRLCEPADGDIVLPQRRMVVVGTTSFEIEDIDYVPIFQDQVELMIERGSELVPALHNTKERGVYMAVRPLIGSEHGGRSVSRTFKTYDHKETENIDGLVTITGGKGSTLRMMAEKLSDVVCSKLGMDVECTTKDYSLLSYRKYYALPG